MNLINKRSNVCSVIIDFHVTMCQLKDHQPLGKSEAQQLHNHIKQMRWHTCQERAECNIMQPTRD